MKVTVKMDGLAGVLDTLKSLPPEVVSKNGGPVRTAVRKASAIIRDEARLQMIARGNSPGKTGINYATGFTAKQIIMKRTKLTKINGERFVVTVKPVPHPNGNKIGNRQNGNKGGKRPSGNKGGKRPLRANDVAFMMEAGTNKQPAEPWLRPSFEVKKEIAMAAMGAELISAVDRIVRKLAMKNKAK